MTRRIFLTSLLALQDKTDPCPIEIDIGSSNTVTVTIPKIAKADMTGIISTFFEHNSPKKGYLDEYKLAFDRATDLSLTLTTKCR